MMRGSVTSGTLRRSGGRGLDGSGAGQTGPLPQNGPVTDPVNDSASDDSPTVRGPEKPRPRRHARAVPHHGAVPGRPRARAGRAVRALVQGGGGGPGDPRAERDGRLHRDPDGRPSSRTVLLKHYDGAGFVFFTNYESRKGRELAANPYASLLFPWHPAARQVVVTGRAERVGREETVAYFRTRPHGSRLGAWASPSPRCSPPARTSSPATTTWPPATPRTPRSRSPALGRLPRRPGDGRVLAGPREPPPRPPALRPRDRRLLARGTPGPVRPPETPRGPAHADDP